MATTGTGRLCAQIPTVTARYIHRFSVVMWASAALHRPASPLIPPPPLTCITMRLCQWHSVMPDSRRQPER
ncbi:hypothetical protein PC116_g16316 [Phytophthora cactorum]|nr:hypothetical protein PC123_g3574 [Phytophthora cactorum]KAG4235562.1 hypothetical protein PC116_g16316 [Phytophthora cactorum]